MKHLRKRAHAAVVEVSSGTSSRKRPKHSSDEFVRESEAQDDEEDEEEVQGAQASDGGTFEIPVCEECGSFTPSPQTNPNLCVFSCFIKKLTTFTSKLEFVQNM